ncbi:MAG: M12 family metallopeptidase, partial [Saprospiraceae bacterium]
MKSLLSLVIFCSLSIAVAQAQEEADFRMCTEIFLDPPETDDLSNLPPGMVARAVAFKPELGKYWTNGKTLRVGFISGSETARSRVRKYAQEWSQVANIQFLFVEKGETDLRVSFVPGLGSWSMIGTDASRIPQYKQTINFGWFGPIPESEYRANVLHEFGHALGLLHEHQHPQGGIPW